ncbi:hypothetical protein [Secundilactobacillus paracollinoides]|nr:hypothetical protein [Secundilactobacillus paracollinoides]
MESQQDIYDQIIREIDRENAEYHKKLVRHAYLSLDEMIAEMKKENQNEK